jgi:leader peptidase (prepilin peptidase)/N-methyltransferase
MLSELQYIDQEFPIAVACLVFVFGSLIGSFLNVCIYRIPAEKSIVFPGSTCACGQPIKWFDNIPILSWFILRGQARCCGAPYSFRYPFVELLTASLFLGAWIQHPHATATCLWILVSMLVCATFIDLDHMEIPDRFSIGLALCGLILSAIVPSLHGISEPVYAAASIKGLFESALGIMIGSGMILWIALGAETMLRKEAMGFGDVKLVGGIGAFLGWQGATFALFGGAVIGTIVVLLWAVIRGAIGKSSGKKKGDSNNKGLIGREIPFGPMLASGALIYTLVLEEPVDLYLSLVLELLG